jgi:hypothetical protein
MEELNKVNKLKQIAAIYKQMAWSWAGVGIPTGLHIAATLLTMIDDAIEYGETSTGGLTVTYNGKEGIHYKMEIDI